MIDFCIIYPDEVGGISICYPIGSEPQDNPREFATRIAHKDVPLGLPFLVVPVSDVPSDRSERTLWTADFSNPDGIAGQQ